MSDWLLVASQSVEHAAHFSAIQNYLDDYRLRRCISLRGQLPHDTQIVMKPEYPDDIQLTDCLYGSSNLLFVNERTRNVFADERVEQLEFLPIRVLNHKGRQVRQPYFVINILGCADCIDTTRSTLEWNSIDPRLIDAVERLYLHADKLPAELGLFRPARLPSHMLIQRSLAERITAAGLRGFAFTELDAFTYP